MNNLNFREREVSDVIPVEKSLTENDVEFEEDEEPQERTREKSTARVAKHREAMKMLRYFIGRIML